LNSIKTTDDQIQLFKTTNHEIVQAGVISSMFVSALYHSISRRLVRRKVWFPALSWILRIRGCLWVPPRVRHY